MTHSDFFAPWPPLDDTPTVAITLDDLTDLVRKAATLGRAIPDDATDVTVHVSTEPGQRPVFTLTATVPLGRLTP